LPKSYSAAKPKINSTSDIAALPLSTVNFKLSTLIEVCHEQKDSYRFREPKKERQHGHAGAMVLRWSNRGGEQDFRCPSIAIGIQGNRMSIMPGMPKEQGIRMRF
jgi:hypothetical protein